MSAEARDVEVVPEDRPSTGFLAGQVLAKRYRLEERVGRGGMGEVWSAFDCVLGKHVALKIVDFDAGDAESARARFVREAALAGELRGRAFAEVFDHGALESGDGDQTFSRRAYLAMELLEGESLLDRLRRVGRLTPAEALLLLRGVAEGLRVAHALQIVHRDLKPSNVFFARVKSKSSGVQALAERVEVVKILDFGIAKDPWDGSRLTRPGMVLGSASYMSPEQIQSGRDVDTRADLWSLAVILYRCLTGHRPFPGTGGEVFAQIVHDAVPAASSVHARLPTELDAFFDRALAKNQAVRFSTVDEMLGVLSGVFEDPPKATHARDSFASVDVDVTGFEDFDDVFERETIVEKLDIKSVFERAKIAEGPRMTGATPPPLPRASTRAPYPTPATLRPPPSAAVARPAPSAAVAPPAPSAAVARPAPSAAVARPAPSAAVARPAPSAAVAPPWPSAPPLASPPRRPSPTPSLAAVVVPPRRAAAAAPAVAPAATSARAVPATSSERPKRSGRYLVAFLVVAIVAAVAAGWYFAPEHAELLLRSIERIVDR